MDGIGELQMPHQTGRRREAVAVDGAEVIKSVLEEALAITHTYLPASDHPEFADRARQIAQSLMVVAIGILEANVASGRGVTEARRMADKFVARGHVQL
jgi:hypothetical protein